MIPHKYPQNPSLGTWVDTQRRRYRKYLTALKEKQGNKNGANNVARAGDEGTHITESNISQSNIDLAIRTGPVMSKEQVDRLISIGFVFEPRLSREETWNRRVQELSKYKKMHGHCNVREDDKSNPGLGKWVSYVRRSHRLAKQGRRAKGKRLSDDRVDQLKTIGFVFELKEEMTMKRYRDGIETLKEFHAKEGHCGVPTFYASNPTFGLCVEDMRKEYRKFIDGKECGLDKDILDVLTNMNFLSEEHFYFHLPTVESQQPIQVPPPNQQDIEVNSNVYQIGNVQKDHQQQPANQQGYM
jgi:hypothetical protein